MGIVFGGRSGEHEVSLMSARSVVAALDPEKYEVVGIGVTREGRWLMSGDPLVKLLQEAGAQLEPGPGSRSVALAPDPASATLVPLENSGAVTRAGEVRRPDVIFPLIHGTHGEDGSLQGLLELAELPYVGPGILAAAVGMDKAVFKAVMQAHGIPVASYRLIVVPAAFALRLEPTAAVPGLDTSAAGPGPDPSASGLGSDASASAPGSDPSRLVPGSNSVESARPTCREDAVHAGAPDSASSAGGRGDESLDDWAGASSVRDAERGWIDLGRELGYPLFVKPANGGSSLGVTKVKREEALVMAIRAAAEYDRRVLLERAIAGREIECAVLGNDEPQASVAGEVIPGHEFYDYEDKYYDDKARFEVPARITDEQMAAVRELSVRAFKAIDGAGMARVDFFLEEGTGALFLNEVNTIPGFTRISMYPKLWEASGLSFPRLLDRLILLALERAEAMRDRKLSP